MKAQTLERQTGLCCLFTYSIEESHCGAIQELNSRCIHCDTLAMLLLFPALPRLFERCSERFKVCRS